MLNPLVVEFVCNGWEIGMVIMPLSMVCFVEFPGLDYMRYRHDTYQELGVEVASIEETSHMNKSHGRRKT